LSHLRIRIENAFAGCGILWRPLRVRLKNQPSLIKCLCKLHNLCIDEKQRAPPLSAPPTGTPPPMAASHTEGEFNTDVIKRIVQNG
jgi:hypothetical protein